MNNTHYLETQSEKRKRLQSSGLFIESAICGNGNPYARTTRNLSDVTCPKCLEKLAQNQEENRDNG